MLNRICKHLKLIGLIAILISIATWAMDITNIVYECPYCRTQRTVIGLLGLLILCPRPFHWFVKYLSGLIGFLGMTVGSMQHFRGWSKIMSGEFKWGEQWYINSWLLSGFAIFIISALVLLIWSSDQIETAER